MFSVSAFAIDFNKVTGSFEIQEKVAPASEDSIAAVAFGSFNPAQDKRRAPASFEETTEEVTAGINEVTGTFR